MAVRRPSSMVFSKREVRFGASPTPLMGDDQLVAKIAVLRGSSVGVVEAATEAGIRRCVVRQDQERYRAQQDTHALPATLP